MKAVKRPRFDKAFDCPLIHFLAGEPFNKIFQILKQTVFLPLGDDCLDHRLSNTFDCCKPIADIAIVLAGAFPLVYVITKVFKKPLMGLGKVLGMNEVAAAGLVASLANSIPMFGMMKDMDDRGKVLNVAFAVSAAFVFGDHLGFTAGFNQDMIIPMIVGKLVGGITAVFAALILVRNKKISKEA